LTTLFGILVLLVVGVTTVVLLSFAMAWYEYANRNPALLESRFTFGNLLFAGQLIVTETACLLLTILLQPLGWFNRKEKPAPNQLPPVVFLHGLFQNQACWLWMKWFLRRQGITSLHTLNLPPWKDVETLTEKLAKKVDELRHATGRQKVHLVGHSMGGIIARNYLQLRGGSEKVDRCILLATPNHGSKLAPFALSPLGCLLMPGSAFLQRLSAAPLPANTRITTVYSRHDNIILPFESASLQGADNFELTAAGHTTLLFRRQTLDTLAGLLKGETL
jgi:pimeloyl-ACP methyl ester carboxylesterase